ncbi:MAG: DMT family transporter, partial [Clostridia bacterium]|nr:DMT family transporter [Clostridia bacterium]
MKKLKTEYLCAAISILLWASISPVTKLLLAEIDTMQIVFIGSIFALIFVIIVSLIKNKRILPKEYKPKDYFYMSVTGLCGIFFYQLFFCLATYRLPAQEAFTINYLWPIMTVVFACLLLKEKLTFTKALGLALSFAGVIIVLTKFNLSSIAG